MPKGVAASLMFAVLASTAWTPSSSIAPPLASRESRAGSPSLQERIYPNLGGERVTKKKPRSDALTELLGKLPGRSSGPEREPEPEPEPGPEPEQGRGRGQAQAQAQGQEQTLQPARGLGHPQAQPRPRAQARAQSQAPPQARPQVESLLEAFPR